MDSTLALRKALAVERIHAMLTDIEFTNDPLVVESKLYGIETTAKMLVRTFREKNCTDHNCDHSFMRDGAPR